MAWKSKKASSIANFETTDKVYILLRGNQQLEKKEKKKGYSNRESGSALRRNKLSPDGTLYFPKTHSFNVRNWLRLQTKGFPKKRKSPDLLAQEATMHLSPSFVLRHHLRPRILQKNETKKEALASIRLHKRHHLQKVHIQHVHRTISSTRPCLTGSSNSNTTGLKIHLSW